MKQFLIIFSFVFICATCKRNKDCNYSITIKNNSTSKVLVQGFENDGDYKDSIMYCPFYGGVTEFVNSNESTLFRRRECWQKILTNKTRFYLFIIDVKNFDLNTPCDTIRKNCKVLFKKQYTIEDLEKINFIVEYK